MSEKDFGAAIVLAGLTVVLPSPVVYGLLMGEIPTLGGTGRYDSEILWQSREDEPRLFWFAVGFHLVLGVVALALSVSIARDPE